jgi:hypothetical protein
LRGRRRASKPGASAGSSPGRQSRRDPPADLLLCYPNGRNRSEMKRGDNPWTETDLQNWHRLIAKFYETFRNDFPMCILSRHASSFLTSWMQKNKDEFLQFAIVWDLEQSAQRQPEKIRRCRTPLGNGPAQKTNLASCGTLKAHRPPSHMVHQLKTIS